MYSFVYDSNKSNSNEYPLLYNEQKNNFILFFYAVPERHSGVQLV